MVTEILIKNRSLDKNVNNPFCIWVYFLLYIHFLLFGYILNSLGKCKLGCFDKDQINKNSELK